MPGSFGWAAARKASGGSNFRCSCSRASMSEDMCGRVGDLLDLRHSDRRREAPQGGAITQLGVQSEHSVQRSRARQATAAIDAGVSGCSLPLAPNKPPGGRMSTAASPVASSARYDNELSVADVRRVIFASSLGTVFEWYDFYLYGSLAAIISKQFFSLVNPTAAFIFALLAFAAGFAMRPFGALVFGRLGDLVGRKYTFLITILIMGMSTFGVGLLPNYATIGIAAPTILITLRILQGLALGGEYGGAATYVAEHAPNDKRGAFTSWIRTAATLGLFLALLVILGTRTAIGEEGCGSWGWRIPFLVSV